MKDRLEEMMNSLDGKSPEEVFEIFISFISNLTPEDSKELDKILEIEIRSLGDKFGFPKSMSVEEIVLNSNFENPRDTLEKMLEDSIKNEQYELAAELRDSIKQYDDAHS